MTATDTPRNVRFHPCGPERILHIGDVGGTTEAATGTMRTGPWMAAADGGVCAGTVGVLADVVWGGAAVALAPSDLWGVSTELAVSFGAPLPDDGSLLRCTAAVVHHDEHAALATGAVRTADGRVVASGTQRTRFVPADHADQPFGEAAGDASATAGGFAHLLGVRFGTDGLSAQLDAGPECSNPAGHVHGGILFALSEIVATHAVAAATADLSPTSLSILYLRRAQIGDPVRCEADVAYRGRTAAAVVARCLRPDGKVSSLATVNYGPVGASNS